MKLLQCNINRCRAAHDLVETVLSAGGYGACLVSEPNRARAESAGWLIDGRGDAAVWVSREMVIKGRGRREGFCWVDTGDVVLYSCYVSPNASQTDFEVFLADLERSVVVWGRRRLVVVAGDFNSAATEWGSRATNRRGEQLLEMVAGAGLHLLNDGYRPTFRRRDQESFLDLTFCSDIARDRVSGWRVLEQETLSDHLYLEYRVDCSGGLAPNEQGPGRVSWHAKRLCLETVRATIVAECDALAHPTPESVSRVLRLACESAAPKVHPKRKDKTPKYWWTAEIAEARRDCVKKRRTHTRNRGRPLEADAHEQYRSARKHLSWLIRRSKQRCWNELCEDVDRDVWGTAYKIVMRKLGVSAPRLPAELVDEVVQRLFPQRPVRQWQYPIGEAFDFSPVTLDEIRAAAARMSSGKAPGTDGVPPEVVKIFMRAKTGVFADLVNTLISEGCFPRQWKTARLVLIPKPGKCPEEPSSYRPLCLLDTVGKALEAVLAGRLTRELEDRGVLADSQYGFRAGRSTLDALGALVGCAAEERGKTWRTRQFCLAIMLDVRNAFNSIPWEVIMDAAVRAGVSPYLRRMIGSYLQDREIQTAEGRGYPVTAGVPQGSILGPTLWNLAYNGVLELTMPDGVKTVAYADDLVLVIKARDEATLQSRANRALELVSNWMSDHQLELAPEKTEAILLIGRKRCRPLEGIVLNGHPVHTRPEAKYLGVMLDRGLNFSSHLTYARERAAKAVRNLSRLMPRVRGAGEGPRRVLASVATSIMTYAAPIWVSALDKERNCLRLRSAQRLIAIRVSRAYRTVATNAVLVLARQVPWELLARERSERWLSLKTVAVSEASVVEPVKTGRELRIDTMNKWQQQWHGDESTGQWTRRLLPDLGDWFSREHGQLTYHLTQVLSGHGCFQEYLWKRKRAERPECLLCATGEPDNAAHTLLQCAYFGDERRRLENAMGWTLTAEGLVPKMLEGEDQWMTIAAFIGGIMAKKESLERTRRRLEETVTV